MSKRNYAQFRRELKELCSAMDEQEVYRNWLSHIDTVECPTPPIWHPVQTPILGFDSNYHYVYLTVTPDKKIYVGKHSARSLDDGYHGSGDEIRERQDKGEELTTTILEFFRSDAMALAAERDIVTREFILEDDVLNQTQGGDDSRHDNDMKSHDIVPKSCPKVVQPTIPSPTLKIPPTTYELPKEACDVIDSLGAAPKPTPAKPVKKGNWWPFNRLGIAVGEVLTFAKDESIACKVLDDICMVEYRGKPIKLTDLTRKLMEGKKGKYTTLGFWKYRGRFLVDIADEITASGK